MKGRAQRKVWKSEEADNNLKSGRDDSLENVNKNVIKNMLVK